MKINQISSVKDRSTLLGKLLFCAIIFSVSSMFAQKKSTIKNIRSNNINETAVTLTLNGKAYNANIGDTLNSGAKLVIPTNTIVILNSDYGKQVCKAKDKPMEYIVEFKGLVEKHTVKGKGASIENTIKKGVGPNYRVTNGRGTTTASKTTIFTFTDHSEGKSDQASVVTTEGSVNIIDQVPVYVGGIPVITKRRGAALTKSISVPQTEGEAEYFANNNPVGYANYSLAIQGIYSDINSRPDPDDRANNYLCLGELYLDTNEPQLAAEQFRQAVAIYDMYYGDEDMSTIEANLSLAEALMVDDPNSLEADSKLSAAEDILLNFLSYDNEDLKYINDPEERALICEDITELNEFLGWLYEIKGDLNESQAYYNDADNGCF